MTHSDEVVLDAGILAALKKFDTPTICNALEIVAPQRRLTGFTVRQLVCPFPDLPPIVGYARTATIRAAVAPEVQGEASRRQRAAYYEYVGTGAGPRISLIQDLDGSNAGYGAFWGEVNSAIHKALGCEGVITDGSIRDIPQWAPGFQALAGSIGPSHAHVHLEGFAGSVTVAGMVVQSGDLIHADRHGAVVIPPDVAADIPAAVEVLSRREDAILRVVRAQNFTIADLHRAMASAAEIH